jgi:predicted Zn-dependent peptidase
MVARKYLRPEDMTIVVVGDKKTVAPQVKPYEQGAMLPPGAD